ncbi:MAG: PEP-CTERM sorting domain-containing protein [Phycisphaerae bacterium]|nr:PEP-CTERM sorting domain-containing protein [Phycisphaerae bacterium]
MRSQARVWARGLVVVGALALFSGFSTAAALVDDTNAIAAWQGTKSFFAFDAGLHAILSVDVEYAVYGPGDYGGIDPSGGTEYVYAYQIFNDLAGNVPVTLLSVGINPDANPTIIGQDSTAGTPGGTPLTFAAFSGTPPTSAIWYFTSNPIDPPTELSQVLLVTSIHAPEWHMSTISSGGVSDMQELPSPDPYAPEPATIGLIAIGVTVVMGARRRRKK